MSEKSSEEIFNGNIESDESWILLKSSASNMDVKSSVTDEQPPPDQDEAKSEGSSVEILTNKDEDKIDKDNETDNVQSASTGNCDHPDGDLSDGISIISETEGAETRSPAIEYLIQQTATEEQVGEEEVEEEEEEEVVSVITTKDGSDQSGFIVNKSLIPSLRPRRKLTPTSSKKRPKKIREAIEPRRDGVSKILMLGCAIIAVAIVLPFFAGRKNPQEEVSKLEVLLDRFEAMQNHINSLSEDMSKMRHEFENIRFNLKPPDEKKEVEPDVDEDIKPTETFTLNDLFSDMAEFLRENIVTSFDEGNVNILEPSVAVEEPKIENPTPEVSGAHKDNPYQQQQQPPPTQKENRYQQQQQQPPSTRYDNQYKKDYNKNYKNENNKYPQKPNEQKEYDRKDNDYHKQKRNEEWRHDNGYKKDYNKNYNENQKYEKNYKDQSKRNDHKYHHQNDKYGSEKYKGETNYDTRKNPENYKGDKEHDSDWYQNMMNHRQEHREKNNQNNKNEYNWYIKRGGERERVREQDEKYHH